MLENDKSILKKWAWGLAALFAFFFLAWKLGNVAILIMLSFIVAYIINPLVTKLATIRFVGRTSATLITLFGLTVGFITVLFY